MTLPKLFVAKKKQQSNLLIHFELKEKLFMAILAKLTKVYAFLRLLTKRIEMTF